MSLINEIKKSFYSASKGLIKKDGFYIIKEGNNFGVALDNINKISVHENFSNVTIRSISITTTNGNVKELLSLTANKTYLRDQFAVFAAQFVDLHSRKKILNEPLKWWSDWKELIGNKMHNKNTYYIIAELITIEKLLQEGEKGIKWEGPKGSSIDIETSNFNIEVKSSIVKYENEITISSQFQMNTFENHYLVYFKMESMSGGESINKVATRIKKLDEDLYYDIEEKLTKRGYHTNGSSRKKTYMVHDIRLYKIDENFPKITQSSFKDGYIGENIKKIVYTVSLDGIIYKDWKNGGTLC